MNAVVSAVLICVFCSVALAMGLIYVAMKKAMEEYLPLHAIYELGDRTLAEIDPLLNYCYELAERKSLEERRCRVAEYYDRLLSEYLGDISRIASAKIGINVAFIHEIQAEGDDVVVLVRYLVNGTQTRLKKVVELDYLKVCELIDVANELASSLRRRKVVGEFDEVGRLEDKVREEVAGLLRGVPEWIRARVVAAGDLPLRKHNESLCEYSGNIPARLVVRDLRHKPRILRFEPSLSAEEELYVRALVRLNGANCSKSVSVFVRVEG